jgi:hypothetical protein
LLHSSNERASELLSGVDDDAKQENTEQESAEQGSTEQGSAEHENAETEDAEQEDGATSTLGATLTSDLLSDHDDWPKWLIDGIDHLQIISCAKSWITLLAGIVKLDRSLGFPTAVRVSEHDIVF